MLQYERGSAHETAQGVVAGWPRQRLGARSAQDPVRGTRMRHNFYEVYLSVPAAIPGAPLTEEFS
jgi:hypothetical protein